MSMDHHSSGQPPRINQELEKLMQRFHEQTEGRAKREYPNGRVSGDDDGALAFAITADPVKNIVVIDFGKLVEWVGMPPEQAVQMANLILKHARSIAKTSVVVEV